MLSMSFNSYPTFKMEESKRLEARQALVAGALGDKLKLLSKLLVGVTTLSATNPARDPRRQHSLSTPSPITVALRLSLLLV